MTVVAASSPGTNLSAKASAIPIDTRRGSRSLAAGAGLGSGSALDASHLIDQTGDTWELTTRRKTYFDSEEKFVVTFIALFKLMYQRRLMGEVRLLVDWLCGSITEGNLVSGFSQRRVHEETGISRCNVSGLMAKLEQHEIAWRGGTGEVWLNPRLVFMGKPARQREACQRWDELVAAARREQLAVADARKAVS